MNITKAKDKIAKLLATAQSDNEHEAKLALSMAQKLAVNYQLDFADCVAGESEKGEFEENVFAEWTKKPVIWKHVTNILMSCYSVKILTTTRYKQVTVSFVGRTENIEFAKMNANYLMEVMPSLWKKYKIKNNLPTKFKYSYLLGLEIGIQEKLAENLKATINQRAKELSGQVSEFELATKYELAIKSEKDALENAIEKMFPKVKTAKAPKDKTFNGDIARQGYEDGLKLNMGGKVAGLLS